MRFYRFIWLSLLLLIALSGEVAAQEEQPTTESAVSLSPRAAIEQSALEQVYAQSTAAANQQLPYRFGGNIVAVGVRDDSAFVGMGNRFVILDVTDPSLPSVVDQTIQLYDQIHALHIDNNYVYVSVSPKFSDISYLYIIDIAHVNKPIIVGQLTVPDFITSIAGTSPYVYLGVSDDKALVSVDVSDPANPRVVGKTTAIPGRYNGIYHVQQDGDYVYAAGGDAGMLVFDVSDPTNPHITGQGATPVAESLALQDNYAYVLDSRDGLYIFDISLPSQPQNIATLDFEWNQGADVDIGGNYAYIANSFNVRVVDISDPANPLNVAYYDGTNSGTYREIVAQENNVFLTTSNGGLRILDVATPSQPNEIGVFGMPVTPRTFRLMDNFAYVAGGAAGLYIMDVSNPTYPVVLRNLAGNATAAEVDGRFAYVLEMNDSHDGIRILDVSDPTVPVEAGYYLSPDGWGHAGLGGFRVSGDFAYVLSRDPARLEIIDVRDPGQPHLVGVFDVAPMSYPRAQDLEVVGDFAYLLTAYGDDANPAFLVVDVSDPTQPRLRSEKTYSWSASRVVVYDTFAYVIWGTTYFFIYDVSDPDNVEQVGRMDKSGTDLNDALVSGSYLYVSDVFRLRIYSLAQPAHPVQIAEFYSHDAVLAVNGPYGYFSEAGSNSGLIMADYSFFTQPLGIPAHLGGADYAVAVQDDVVYVGEGYRLSLYDVARPESPTLLAKTALLDDLVRGVALSGDVAYVAAGNGGFVAVDVSDTAKPTVVDEIETSGFAWNVHVAEDVAYVAEGESSFEVFDISDPAHLRLISHPNMGRVWDIDSDEDEFGYLAADIGALDVADFSRPDDIRRLGGSVEPQITAQAVSVVDAVAYVAAGHEGLVVFDVYNPNDVQHLRSYPLNGYAIGVDVYEDMAHVTDWHGGVHVVDVSDLDSVDPAIRSLGFPGSAWQVDATADIAYVADEKYGVRVIDVSDPEALHLVATPDNLASARAFDFASGYAIIATGERLIQSIDLSDSSGPALVAELDLEVQITDLAIEGDHAFVIAADGSLRVLDVSNPAAMRNIGQTTTSGVARRISVANGTAYIAGGPAGLQLLDITDPTHPTEIGHYDAGATVVSAFPFNDLAYAATGTDGLHILDISDPTSPKLLTKWPTLGSVSAVYADAHHAYLVEDEQGLVVLDVLQPSQPSQVGVHFLPFTGVDIWKVGNQVFVTGGEAGMRVLDVSQATAPRLTGAFETGGESWSVRNQGGDIYLADGTGGLLRLNQYRLWTPLTLR